MLSFFLTSIAIPASPSCPLPFEIAGNAAAARAIAEIVVAAKPQVPPDKNILRYDLHVSYIAERRSWSAYESPVTAAKGVRMLGGNGLAMEIAACNGAVSDVHRMR